MPTLELHGFAAAAADKLVAEARALLDDLPYREDIVFDSTRAGGKVLNWGGAEQPFIRICSRSQEKLDELRNRLVGLADVETLVIGFFPQMPE
ncbi:MAG: hypothetical protein H0T69_06690 [Thermoleophilaceae bacterium]|nr:hypothetical protein [Thermoleophilaceae bacterium]